MNFEETYQWYEYLRRTDRWAADYALRELREIADNEAARERYQMELTETVMGFIEELREAKELQVRPRERDVLFKLYSLGLSNGCVYTLLNRCKNARLTKSKARMILSKYRVFDVDERMYGGW